ncbi:sucrase ferredoxin [soil metagenome]
MASFEGWLPCSDRSLERGDPLAGTAGYGERWFLVEIDGAWGQHAFLQSRLDAGLAARLVARLEGAGIRPLAIRRTGRNADERRAQSRWRWAYVDARPGREQIRWGVTDDPADLLEVPLDGTAGEPSTEPIYGVCTHARHDQCCAVKGRPVVTALAASHPEQTWECSHLGGDRFAATMIVFPHGLLYGRVTAEAADDVVAAYADGIADPQFLRGRTSLPNVAQAAIAEAVAVTGDTRIDAYRYGGHEATAERITVRLTHDGKPLEVTLRETTSAPLLSTCAATLAAPVRQYVLA